MKRCSFAFILTVAVLAVTCSREPTSPSSATGTGANSQVEEGAGDPSSAAGNTPLSATIEFGQPRVGSPFPPPSGHDQSAHAKDNLVPRTVVIKTGGSVTFEVPALVHQIAIYKPGRSQTTSTRRS